MEKVKNLNLSSKILSYQGILSCFISFFYGKIMLLELFLSSVDLVPGDTILLPTTGTPTYLCKVGDPQISSANILLAKRGRITYRVFQNLYTIPQICGLK
jgi:hypothetical protein